MTAWMEFRKCAGCGLDFGTGEGQRACAGETARTSLKI